jgi:hypothetical protein
MPITLGLPRFFAWAAILWLFINNVEYWFRKPFSVYQILSWSFFNNFTAADPHGSLDFADKGKT